MMYTHASEKMGIESFLGHQMSGVVNIMRNRNKISVLVTCIRVSQLKNAFSLLHCLSFLPQLFLGQNNNNKKTVNTGSLTSCVSEVAIELNSIVMNSRYGITL